MKYILCSGSVSVWWIYPCYEVYIMFRLRICSMNLFMLWSIYYVQAPYLFYESIHVMKYILCSGSVSFLWIYPCYKVYIMFRLRICSMNLSMLWSINYVQAPYLFDESIHVMKFASIATKVTVEQFKVYRLKTKTIFWKRKLNSRNKENIDFIQRKFFL